MRIFKATATAKRTENNERRTNISFMYYFIHEFSVHYGKILNDANAILHESTDTDENAFLQNIESFLNSNFSSVSWIGEAKFDNQTENMFNSLRKKYMKEIQKSIRKKRDEYLLGIVGQFQESDENKTLFDCYDYVKIIAETTIDDFTTNLTKDEQRAS